MRDMVCSDQYAMKGSTVGQLTRFCGSGLGPPQPEMEGETLGWRLGWRPPLSVCEVSPEGRPPLSVCEVSPVSVCEVSPEGRPAKGKPLLLCGLGH
jgi:hypothetical protein